LYKASDIQNPVGLVNDQDITQENIEELQIIEPDEIPVITVITNDTNDISTVNATYVDLTTVEQIADGVIPTSVVELAAEAEPILIESNDSETIDLTELETTVSTTVNATESEVILDTDTIPVACLEG